MCYMWSIINAENWEDDVTVSRLVIMFAEWQSNENREPITNPIFLVISNFDFIHNFSVCKEKSEKKLNLHGWYYCALVALKRLSIEL